MAERFTGRCQCGAVSYELTGPVKWSAHCHCRDCRRATGAPFVTWVGFQRQQIRWTGEAPARYASSKGVERGFCGKCGTPLFYQGERWSEEIHLLAGTFDRPEEIKPQIHAYTRDRLPWIHLADGLPTLDGTAGEN